MENSPEKSYLFEEMPIPSAVAKLCVPMVLSSLVTVIYSLADTWFVGLINDPVQNSAITVSAPVLLAFYAVTNLFGVGGSSMMGRALGMKEYNNARKSSAISIYAALLLSLCFSFLFTVLKNPLLNILGASSDNVIPAGDYLFWTVSLGAVPSILNVVLACLVRTEGLSGYAGIGVMSGCIINIILDPFFVLPRFFNMGAAGAGLATFISNTIAFVYFIVLILSRKSNTYVCLNPQKAKPEKYILKNIFIVGIPAAIQNLLNVTGMTILNNMTASYGTDAVAAMGIAYRFNMIPMQISSGLTQGVAPIISYNYGSKNYTRAKKATLFAGEVSAVFLIIFTVICFIISDNIIAFFIKTDTVITLGGVFLKCMIIGTTFITIDFLGVAVYQAIGKGLFSLVFAIMRKIILEIPLLFILNKLFPLYGLSAAQTVTEIILCILAIIAMRRIFTKLEKESGTDVLKK